MTIAIQGEGPAAQGASTGTAAQAATVQRLPGIGIAAAASLGAGAIHAGVVGFHADNVTLARLFIATSLFQLGWGLAALVRPSRRIAVLGAAGNLAIVGGWLLTRLSGVSFINGLEQREAAQFTDTACAMLGMVAAAAAFSAALIGVRSIRPFSLMFPSMMVLAITIPAMLAGADHAHGGSEGAAHSHDSTAAVGAVGAADETAPHDHDPTPVAGDGSAGVAAAGAATTVPTAAAAGTGDESAPHDHGDATAAAAAGSTSAEASTAADPATTDTTHGHDDSGSAVAAPVPYDPALPIDLGGVEGVTPEQQARAENLVAVNLIRLPQWADPAVAEAAGFKSIGDGATGFEHYIQWSWINDDVILDPDFPESLVYEPQPDGTKRLVSAMYMLRETVPLSDVPDIGGALTQWHIHDNLCFTKDPVAPQVVGITDAAGLCPSNLQKLAEAPMIHVWIRSHRCGPFAALEGVGAGQIESGEERLCDHAHGGTGF